MKTDMQLIKTILPAMAVAAMPLIGAIASVPAPENVPELMKTFAGNAVESVAEWEYTRAPEILERYTSEVFGVRPKEADERGRVSFETLEESDALDGKAVRKRVLVNFETPNGRFTFPFVAFIPKSEKPAPAFVLICNRPEAKRDEKFWPVKEIVARGYATASFLFSDIVPDDAKTAFSQGVIATFAVGAERTDGSWGTISAWAWAASRVMDWIETEPRIDAKRVGVVGHSRGGKTALWTGVTDKRFAMVCSNDSGCSGAKLNHIDLPESETIAKINARFPHWFAKNYRKYRGKEREMDFDQHELLALVAPRLLCVASATKDDWAGQRGEWWAAKLASSVWELYGGNGLAAEAFPAPDSPQQDGSISYHLRTGKHDLTPYDWKCYMDFADRHGWRRVVAEAESALRQCGGSGVANPVWAKDFPDPTTWRADDGTYRATSTALTILKSSDFRHWESTGRRVFTHSDEKRIRKEWKNIWAPDAFKLGDEYLLYVSLVNCDTNSAIAVYSSKSPEGPFKDGRIVTRSADTGIRDTIDPEVVRDDRDGTLWLFFGSTGKIHRVKLAPDGKSLESDAQYEHVAGLWGNEKTHPTRKGIFEGCYLHRRGGWWYLFASHGCYWNHTYSIAVGRAKALDGPFLDREGRRMTDGFATPVVESKNGDRFFGPGHNGEIVTIDGRDYIPFHCHVVGERPKDRPLFVSELKWSGDGWPYVESLK